MADTGTLQITLRNDGSRHNRERYSASTGLKRERFACSTTRWSSTLRAVNESTSPPGVTLGPEFKKSTRRNRLQLSSLSLRWWQQARDFLCKASGWFNQPVGPTVRTGGSGVVLYGRKCSTMAACSTHSSWSPATCCCRLSHAKSTCMWTCAKPAGARGVHLPANKSTAGNWVPPSCKVYMLAPNIQS